MDSDRFTAVVTKPRVHTLEQHRLFADTRMINSMVTGREPKPVVVKKDALKDFEFIKKFKEFVSSNSKMETHFKALQGDPEIAAIRREMPQPGGYESSQYSSVDDSQEERSASGLSTLPKVKPGKRDLEALFAKICFDNKFRPVMNIFRKFIDKS